MQSYSQIVDTKLTYQVLPMPGGMLKLPSGWSYSSKKLARTLKLNSSGLGYVVNDDLGDSYQRMSSEHTAGVSDPRSPSALTLPCCPAHARHHPYFMITRGSPANRLPFANAAFRAAVSPPVAEAS